MIKSIDREYSFVRNAMYATAIAGLAVFASTRASWASEEMATAEPASLVAAEPIEMRTVESYAPAQLTAPLPKGTMLPIPDDAPASSFSPVSLGGAGDDKECLATAIYFEARGESAKGQKAVAEVVVRRAGMPGRPSTVCGVVYEGAGRRTGCQFSFTCDRIKDVVRDQDAWSQAEDIAETVLSLRPKRGVSRGAIYFHASNVRPRWARGMVRVAAIGAHYFYRP